ncbi:S8 family serine peptidase [Limnoraphis robusta]|uniref:LysM domain-containing protein n=1 Tax=Limnoraphis robusta CS-951 TaxID=1637645 RepID=A0A0F5YJT3_9CYAN|nr:S8 family serine peptidase [Limnoraphis robusta]KKD39169.1 hypothetical protein WN50_04865 [Limnoraphis robusta CS-951]
MGLLKNLIGFSSSKRQPASGFQSQSKKPPSQETFILESILTPSGLVDGGDDSPDPIIIESELLDEIESELDSEVETASEEDLTPVEVSNLDEVDEVEIPFITDLEELDVEDNSETSEKDLAESNEEITSEAESSSELTENSDAEITESNSDSDSEINQDLEVDSESSSEVEESSTENITQTVSSSESSSNSSTSEESVATASSSEETSKDSTLEESPTEEISDELTLHEESETEDTETTAETSVDESIEETESSTDSETEDSNNTDTVNENESENETDSNAEIIEEIVNSPIDLNFDSGIFTVGETGEIGIDYLFDGGGFGRGELAIFSLEGMEELDLTLEEFIKEAANRALSDSELGHVVISDGNEGAKFSGGLEETDFNRGEYLGVKTFNMRPGDKFAVMLVPNGKVQQVFDNPSVEGTIRPLFSLSTANPEDGFQLGQIADVTGDGNTFVFEDLRIDNKSDHDYNDIIFQVRGASGEAVHLDEVISPNKDWRSSDMGQALIEYAQPYITPEEPIVEIENNLSDLLTEFEDLLDQEESETETESDEEVSNSEVLDTEVIDETVDFSEDEESQDESTELVESTESEIEESEIIEIENNSETSVVEDSEVIEIEDNLDTSVEQSEITEIENNLETSVEESLSELEETEVEENLPTAVVEETEESGVTEIENNLETPVEESLSELEEIEVEENLSTAVVEETEKSELVEIKDSGNTPIVQQTEESEVTEIENNLETSIVEETEESFVIETEENSESSTSPTELIVIEESSENLTVEETDESEVVEIADNYETSVVEENLSTPIVEEAEESVVIEAEEDSESSTSQTEPTVIKENSENSTVVGEAEESEVVEIVDNSETSIVEEAENNLEITLAEESEQELEETELQEISETSFVQAIEQLENVEIEKNLDNSGIEETEETELIDGDNSSESSVLPVDTTEFEDVENNLPGTPPTPTVESPTVNLVNRLEKLTYNLQNQTLSQTPVNSNLIQQLEQLTNRLITQAETNPNFAVSANTLQLIERLETQLITKPVLPTPVEPPVQFEFATENQPLVGIIDTGFSGNNPDIDYSRITWGSDKVDGDADPTLAEGEGNEHGTHVLGIIAAQQNNGIGIDGINDNAPIWAGRAIGSGKWAESLVEFVDAAKASGQPNAVVNLSLDLTQINPDGSVTTRYELTPQEEAAIAYAQKHNIIVVVSAGDNPGTMSALGELSKEFDNLITVGAAEQVNNAVAVPKAYAPASYSGSGDALDIVADGNSGSISSTTVATAKVTGTISQVWAANPDLNYTQVIDIIKRTATDLAQPNWDSKTGAGLLNIAAAITLAKATEPQLYTVKPGQRTITDNFISQNPTNKPLPGDPTHPAATPPGVPQTTVDTGGNSVAEAVQLLPSGTQDIIDQVSPIDPTDTYRLDSRYLQGTEFSVLSGELSVSYLTPSGEVLATQVLGKGSHQLQLPANATDEIILKIDRRNESPATYMLYGFESTATEPFNIGLEFDSPLTTSQQQIMEAVAKSVASLIGKGLPSAVVDGKVIDDINIKISTANIDGASGTQARTKIDFMRYGTMLPAQSLVQFDAADIAELERSGKLFSVVQHEFLHALGFGNLWEAKGLVDYAGTPLAQYNGGKAVDAFKDLGGLTDAISLETEGKGSAGFHWNEALFQDEVMTADLNFSGKAGNAPISPVTIASLADLGYEVNLNAATPDFGLFGGQRFNSEDLTPEQIEAFRQLAEIFGDGDEPSEPAILQEVDPTKVAPEIWAHAERAPNGQYYDWEDYLIVWGDTLSELAEWRMGSGSANNYWWIANHNGIPNPNYIQAGKVIKLPVHRPNYEQNQEAERQRREQELRQRQEQEARDRQQQEDRLRNDQAEQERLRQDEERRRQEAEANQRELEEQARRLAEEQERRRREREEYEREQARLAELRRQAEIARQQGKGGLDWYLAKPMPEFGPVDPFETSLTGETVGNLVPDDYYRFTLSRGGRITAELRKLLADADLVLYDVRNEPIAYSMREGITDEQIIADLIPGTYMLRVNSPKGVTTDYELVVKFQHKLSQMEIGPPPGWKVGGTSNGGGSGGGNTSPGVAFADPRIKQIYNTALNQFESAERGKANAQIRDLEAEKRQYQQELNDLLARMNAEQRNKVYTALDGVRNDAFGWLDSPGETNVFDNLVNGIFDQIPSWVYNVWGIGDALRIAKDTAKGAFNGALSLIKGKVNSARNEIKNAVSWFVEALKNAYRTGGEINSAIEGLARELKGKIDAQVTNINNGIDWFKTEAIKNLGSLRNVGVGGWNFYDNLVVPQADNIANLVKNGVGAIANYFKGTVDYVKPRAQKTVADIVSALLGDQTGNLYNKINGIDQQIAATTRAVEERIVQKAVELKVDVDNWLNKLANDGKKLLDTILTLLNSPGGQIGIEVVKVALGFVPIVGQAIDIIDTAVALWKIVIDGKRDTETFVELLGSLAGWFPGVGDAIKGVAKIALKGPIGALLRKLGPDVTKQVVKVFKEAKWKEILLDVVEGIGEVWSKFDSTMDEAAGWILDLMPGVRPALAGVGDLIRKFSDDAATAGDSLDDISKTIAKKIDDTSEQIAKEDKKEEDPPLMLPGPVRKVPQGLTQAQYSSISAKLRQKASYLSDDIRIHGSRAAGTANPDSDIDIAVRMSPEQYNQFVEERFKTPNPGSAKEASKEYAFSEGKIAAGEAGLRQLRNELEQELGMKVDLSVIKIGGNFDDGPWIALE